MPEPITDEEFNKLVRPSRDMIDAAYHECWEALRGVRRLEAMIETLKQENAVLRASLKALERPWWESAPPFVGDGI